MLPLLKQKSIKADGKEDMTTFGPTLQLRFIPRSRESLRNPSHAAWAVREEPRALARDAIHQHPRRQYTHSEAADDTGNDPNICDDLLAVCATSRIQERRTRWPPLH